MYNYLRSSHDMDRVRRRVEYEDGLLNARSNIVLTLNGLAAVAVGLQPSALGFFVIAVFMFMIDVMWLSHAREASGFIAKLTNDLAKCGDLAPIDEIIRQEFVGSADPTRIGTTTFIGVRIPQIMLAGWVVAVCIVLLVAPFQELIYKSLG